jgi:hypothetical protein
VPLDETNKNRYSNESESQNDKRLNFVITSGPANGYNVIYTKQNLEFHQNKHGSQRPELYDDEFIDQMVVEALKNPDVVYKKIKEVSATGKVSYQKNVYVFYKENKDREYFFNSKVVKSYACVRVRRSRWRSILEIITVFYTAKISEENICQPLTKI